MANGDCKDDGHTCDEVLLLYLMCDTMDFILFDVQTHPCPEECTERGVCKVEVQRKVVEKATFVTGGIHSLSVLEYLNRVTSL